MFGRPSKLLDKLQALAGGVSATNPSGLLPVNLLCLGQLQSSRRPVSPIILREIRGSIDHRWSNVTTFFKKPIPRLYCGDPWAIDSRRTIPSRIFKKTVPVSRGSEGRPPPSPRRSTPSVARPLQGSPHNKSSPMMMLRAVAVRVH